LTFSCLNSDRAILPLNQEIRVIWGGSLPAIALAPSGGDGGIAGGDLNDGLLTSGEIVAMTQNNPLNAELVVLSACETGLGDLSGDGIIGLSRSLITAGVPSIVVSLWEVSDDATRALMREFYTNLYEKKMDKARALRQAMLAMLQGQHPNPSAWSAFTLIGEAE
jgi:CHAT domain-containing protein